MNMSPEAIAAREKYFEEKRKKKKVSPTGVTNNDIEIALTRCAGNVTEAAEFLGMPMHTLRSRIFANPKMVAFRNNIVESFVDETESQLRKLVKAGNPSAIIFVLKTLGKNRGYVERSTVEHELGPYAAKNAANMIEAMKKGMEAAPSLPLPPPRMLIMEEEVDEGRWKHMEEAKDGDGRLQSVESG